MRLNNFETMAYNDRSVLDLVFPSTASSPLKILILPEHVNKLLHLCSTMPLHDAEHRRVCMHVWTRGEGANEYGHTQAIAAVRLSVWRFGNVSMTRKSRGYQDISGCAGSEEACMLGMSGDAGGPPNGKGTGGQPPDQRARPTNNLILSSLIIIRRPLLVTY